MRTCQPVLIVLMTALLFGAGCPPWNGDTDGGDDDTIADDDHSDEDGGPADADGDGYDETVDCDDSDPGVHPGADETTCNGVDDDCDPDTSDEPDGDGDGVTVCEDCDDGDPGLNEDDLDGDGYSTCDGDCDDEVGLLNPGADEGCDGVDTDCDGSLGADEVDDDLDGFNECDGDCDDTDPARYPWNVEVCDGKDNDCNGLDDFGDPGVGGVETDDDGDGMSECEGDCDDADAANFPGNPEVCDGQDNDCNGVSDFGAPGVARLEADDDGDGVSECAGDCDDHDPLNFGGNVEVCDGQDNDCNGLDDFGDPGVAGVETDDDGDGVPECGGDCDDTDAANFAGNLEVCDGQDNDCNGLDDAGSPGVGGWETDDDGDGMPECAGDCDDTDPANAAGHAEACDGQDNDCNGLDDYGDPGVGGQETDDDGDGVAECAGDCDDGDAANFPGNAEVCDGQDNDCNGLDDAGNAGVDRQETDDDGDGLAECEGDCDDTVSANFPGNAEVCDGQDNDCNGLDDFGDPGFAGVETDDDGDGVSECEGDCDDADAANFPGNVEICDGQDNDCNGLDDVGDPGQGGAETDDDGDGVSECEGDCDDADAANVPGNMEVCDGQDNDCNGLDDFGSPGIAGVETDDDGDGLSECEGDCDDLDPAVNPGGLELCNGVDDDCDGAPEPSEVDTDQDGWMVCDGDCDDQSADAYPGASEQCNGQDDDCDGAPEGDEIDGDGDGFYACEDCVDGDPAIYPGAAESCDGKDNDCDGTVPANEVDGDGDGYRGCAECDDGDPGNHPGAPETCDGADNDCDGSVDEGVLNTYYRDADGDGHGRSQSGTTQACSLPGGYSTSNDDCNDGSAAVHPGASEAIGDEVDANCDGGETCYLDYDNDGYRPDGNSTYASGDSDCTDNHEARSSEPTGDCNDSDTSSHPGAAEILQDGADNDCDGQVDECGHNVSYCAAGNASLVSCCIDALGPSGGTVELNWTGESYFYETVNLVSNLTIQGQGKTSTTMVFAGDDSAKLMLGDGTSDVELLDFRMYGTRTQADYTCTGNGCDGASQGCIVIKGDGSNDVTDLLIENVSVKYCRQYGLHVKYANRVEIQNLTAGYNGTWKSEDHNVYVFRSHNVLIADAGSRYSAGHGINIRGCHDVVVVDSTVGYNHHSGIRVSGADGAEDSTYILFENTDSFGNGENGVEAEIESGYNVHRLCVKDSAIEDNGTGVYFNYTSNYQRSNNTYSGNGTKQSISNSSKDTSTCASVPSGAFPFPY